MTEESDIYNAQSEEQQLTAVQFDPSELKRALQTMPEMLMHFLLGDKLTLGVPHFHIDMFNYLTDMSVSRFALAVPRGHAKTTVVKITCVWYFLFTRYRFIVYCSNTTTVAQDECRDIIEFLECGNFRAVFGPIVWEKKDGSSGLYIFKIGDKRCILRALGAGQQVRGLNIDNQRPELLICDDAEDEENSATPGQRAKFRRWVYGPLFKATARNSKKIWVGNLTNSHCLINHFVDSDFWASMRYGCILTNGQPLWPEMFSLDYLRKDYIEYQQAGMAAKWFAEMMNLPVPEGMGLITSEEITYKHGRVPADLEMGFITIDPAISLNTQADNTAIAVHGLVNNVWQVVDYYLGKCGPLEMFIKALDFCIKWRVRVIGIENVAYQAALQPIFRYLLAERGQHGIEVIPLAAGGVRKAERIQAWAGWLKSGTYALTEGESKCTTQLLNYDPAKKENDDDLIDCCAYGPQVITQYFNLLSYSPEVVEIEAQGALQICSV